MKTTKKLSVRQVLMQQLEKEQQNYKAMTNVYYPKYDFTSSTPIGIWVGTGRIQMLEDIATKLGYSGFLDAFKPPVELSEFEKQCRIDNKEERIPREPITSRSFDV